VRGALHLKTACALLDNETVLINRAWIDARAFSAFNLIDVAPNEPFGANILKVGNHVLVQSACPATAAMIAARGFHTIHLDISEFAKAEAGLTCLSLIYETRE
jgi:dimethylargininase